MIEAGFVILALLSPVMVFFAYRKGLQDGKAVEENKQIEPIFTKPARKKEPSEEDTRLKQILANIDAYDGTEKGQKEVIK